MNVGLAKSARTKRLTAPKPVQQAPSPIVNTTRPPATLAKQAVQQPKPVGKPVLRRANNPMDPEIEESSSEELTECGSPVEETPVGSFAHQVFPTDESGVRNYAQDIVVDDYSSEEFDHGDNF
eukprot:TRINITY_DN3323_c0_g1_i2.p1 TRINITY_DN3323_c0_g1~~TRINITY_DN3323_c0_g1_i2.p1  ORF type:complete len:123 (+),score=22.59 TRINITY_DN3323_c0_g1_i2:540-908(+)